MTVVRRFRGHTDRITDLQASQDCRWLISASMDGTVRVWDIPDSRIFQVPIPLAPQKHFVPPRSINRVYNTETCSFAMRLAGDDAVRTQQLTHPLYGPRPIPKPQHLLLEP